MHIQKAERYMVRALKKNGLNIASTSKLAPKLHVIVAEYVRQIQQKRRAAKRASLEIAVIKEENNPWGPFSIRILTLEILLFLLIK